MKRLTVFCTVMTLLLVILLSVKTTPVKSVHKPSLGEPTRKLIASTWCEHAKGEGFIPIEQCLLFFQEQLSEEQREQIRKRGNLHLVKTSEHEGTFRNAGDLVAFQVIFEGKKYKLTIPELLKGTYTTYEDHCLYEPHAGTTLRACRWYFFCADLTKFDAEQKTLSILFDREDANQYYHFD